MSPRQLRAIETRSRLIVAAAEEIEQAGYAAASVASICDRAGVTKGAMYFHFTGKDDLAAAIIRSVAHPISARASTLLAAGMAPPGVLGGVTHHLSRLLTEDVVARCSIALVHTPGGDLHRVPNLCSDWTFTVWRLVHRSAASGLIRVGAGVPAVARLVTATVTGHIQSIALRGPRVAEDIDASWALLEPALFEPALFEPGGFADSSRH